MAAPTTVLGEPTGSTARNSATVAGWTLISRVTGLLRVMVIGAVLGPTYFANTFQAGYVVPNLVYTVVAGPVLAMVLIPTVVRAAAAGGVGRAREVLGRVTGPLLAVSTAIAVGLALLAPVVAWTLTVGIPDAADRAMASRFTTVLVLFVAPQVVLYTIAALGVAAQQARGRFALSAAAPSVENIGMIATVVVAGMVYGTGLEIQAVPMQMVIVLAVGTTVSVGVHAAIQVFGAARAGMVGRPSLAWRRDPAAADVLRRIVRSVGVAACPTAAMYVLLVLAGTVPGGVLVVQLSYAVFYALSYLGARAVSIAVLPGLARAADRGDGLGFASAWRQAFTYAIIASLPLLCLLVVFAEPAADLLANGELRQSVLIAELAACLAVVAVAQLVGGVHDIGRQALFARLDDRGPLLASAVALVVTLVVAVATLLLPAGGPRLVGLTVAILVGELAAAWTVLARLGAALRPERMTETRGLAVAVLATLVTLPVALGGSWLLRVAASGRLAELALLAVGGLASLGVYALVLKAAATRQIGGAS